MALDQSEHDRVYDRVSKELHEYERLSKMVLTPEMSNDEMMKIKAGTYKYNYYIDHYSNGNTYVSCGQYTITLVRVPIVYVIERLVALIEHHQDDLSKL